MDAPSAAGTSRPLKQRAFQSQPRYPISCLEARRTWPDARQKQKAEAQIATLKAQLTDQPDPVIVRQAGRTLRNITEGAIGSLLATAMQPKLWQWIQQVMASHF